MNQHVYNAEVNPYLGLSCVTTMHGDVQASDCIPLTRALPAGACQALKALWGTCYIPPITAVDAGGQGLDARQAFTDGRTATLSDQERTRDLTLRQVPTSLVISNTGSVPLARGITLEVSSAVLDAAGLVVGPRQPVLVSGLENNVRTWLAFSQQSESSTLPLLLPLHRGSANRGHQAYSGRNSRYRAGFANPVRGPGCARYRSLRLRRGASP